MTTVGSQTGAVLSTRGSPERVCRSTVTEEFASAVAQYGTKIAASGDAATFTYEQLDRVSDCIAGSLERAGVGPGDFVPVFFGRSPWYCAAILGILKRGAAYAPIDPEHPPQRRVSMMEDLRAKAGIILRSQAGMDLAGVKGLAVEDMAEGIPAAQHVRCGPDDAAYVMFTSGSTGKPKGVVVPHRGIIRLICWADYAAYEPGRRWAMVTSVGFDLSTQEIWGALLRGGTIVALESVKLGIDKVGAFYKKERITDTVLATALFNMVVEFGVEAFKDLAQVFTGGEQESLVHFRKFKRAHPNVRLIHCYGPTEATTWSHVHTVRDQDVVSGRVPVGGPIAGSKHRIMVEGRDGGAGEVGELILGGPGIALGYLNRPELTAEKFVRFGDDPSLWYKTGDAAKEGPDGLLTILGRMDRQIKFQGVRIELEEIESALAQCPGVRGAAVELLGETQESKRLIAFCAGGTVEGIKARLKELLPSCMVPSGYFFLCELPLNTSGKINRPALREIAKAGRPVG